MANFYVHILSTSTPNHYHLGHWGDEDGRTQQDRLSEWNASGAEGAARHYGNFAVHADDPLSYPSRGDALDAVEAHKLRLTRQGASFHPTYKGIFTYPTGSQPAF